MGNYVLVVDDEVGIRELLYEILNDEGYNVRVAANAMEARQFRQETRPDLVLLDIWMPQMDGITLLKEWGAAGQLNMPVVMMSGHATVETAVEATRIGAFDFLEKPITLPKLLATVERALKQGGAGFRPELTVLQLGRGALIADLRRKLDQLAQHKAPLLLTGEAGCGVELVARHLHRPNTPWFSPETSDWLVDNPFEPLNECQGGVVFIPDVEPLTKVQQKGLLQLLGKLEKHQIRLVCASTKSVAQLHQLGHVDTELLSRLSALTLAVPPLREHPEDIPELATTLLTRMTEAGEVPVRTFSTGALNVLRGFQWPGNIIALTNAVRTLAMTASSTEITTKDALSISDEFDMEIRPEMAQVPFDLPLREARDLFEKAYLEHHIRKESGNMSRVAERAGLERTHLYRKLKQLGVRQSSSRNDE